MTLLRPFREFRTLVGLAGPIFEGKRVPMIRAATWALAGALLALARPWPMKFVIDGFKTSKHGVSDQPAVWLIVAVCVGTLLLACLSGLCATEEAKATADVAKSITTRLRKRVMSHLHGLPMGFHHAHGSGELLVRLMGDVSNVRDLIFDSWMGMGAAGITFIGGVIAMTFIHPWLALTVIIPVPILLWSMRGNSVRLTAVTRRARRKEGVVASFASESLRQITTIKAFGAAGDVVRTFGREARSSERAAGMATELAARIERQGEIVAGFGVAALLGLGALAVSRDAMTPGDLVVLVSYARTLAKPIRGLSKQGARTSKALASATRLRELLQTPIEDQGPPVEAPSNPGTLTFKNVSVAYPNGTRALDGLTCTLRGGALIALTGPNGAGKSTTLNVLLRLVTPESGEVHCDHGAITDFSLTSWRARISYVPQSLQLLAGSIRDNLHIADAASDDTRLEQAFEQAGAADLLASLPEGLDTIVGEGGCTLSGGQARRLMLARAALREAPLILLDEPFAGLDAIARSQVADAINKIARGRTVIVVTHEALDLLKPDVTLRIDHGRLVSTVPS